MEYFSKLIQGKTDSEKVAKFTASAKLTPKLKPAWRAFENVITNSPGF